MKNIGLRIKELRKKNDLTQEKLAEYLGVTYKSVSKWECGLTMPDLALIVPLSKALGVSTDELLGAKESTPDWKNLKDCTMKQQKQTTRRHVYQSQKLPQMNIRLI